MSKTKYQSFPTIIKIVISTSFAFLISLFLFYFMSILISKTPNLTKDEMESGIIEFIRTKPHTFLDKKKRKLPEKKSKDKPPPPAKVFHSALQPKAQQLKMNIQDLKSSLKKSFVGGSFNHLDRGGSPLIRVNPEFPIKARLKGIEGWVKLTFSITKTGSVTDIKVLDSRPHGVFEKSAIQAVSKWKYQPLMEDGKPIKQTNQSTYVNFTLE